MTLCGSVTCGCAITSDTLSISGDGSGDNPFQIEGAFPTVVTSTTRPVSPSNGQVIYETDTRMFAVWKANFAAWVYQQAGCSLLQPSHSATVGTSTVSWASETYDRGGYWSSGSTITVPAGHAGPHVITFSLQGASAFADPSSTVINAAGAAYRARGGSSTSSLMHNTVVRDLAAGETITAQIGSSAAATVVSACRLEVVRLIW